MSRTVLVVGAGVVGCSLAYELARLGVQVTVIDSAEPGSGTSSATFAWVNSNDKSPESYRDLNLLGVQAHEVISKQLRPEQRWFHQTGTIQLGKSVEELEKIDQKISRLSEYGYPSERLTHEDVQRLEPGIDPDSHQGGALYSREGWIDTQKMCWSLLSMATSLGASIRPGETIVTIDSSQVISVDASGTYTHHSADVVVLAAGNGTKQILRDKVPDYPIIDPLGDEAVGELASPNTGIMTTTTRVPQTVNRIVRAAGIAMRPARNGGITFADHPTGGKWSPGDARVWSVPGELFQRAQYFVPALKSAVIDSVRLGTRVLPRDGLTISDWINKEQDIYVVTTHSGVTLAAHLARCIAEELTTGQRDPSLNVFGLTRPSLSA